MHLMTSSYQLRYDDKTHYLCIKVHVISYSLPSRISKSWQDVVDRNPNRNLNKQDPMIRVKSDNDGSYIVYIEEKCLRYVFRWLVM